MSISGDGSNDLQGSQRPPDDTEIDLGLNQEEFPDKKNSDSPKKRKRSEFPSSGSSTSESSSSSSSDESHSSAAKKKKSAKKKKLFPVRPLPYLGTRLTDPDCKEALEMALHLWGVAFNDITKSRRRNIIRQTDPKMESLLEDQDNFDLSESYQLFGRYFLKAMVRSTDEEAKLNVVNRSSGSSTIRHRRESRGGRHDHRKDRHPYRSDKGYGNKNPGFPQQNKYVSPPLKTISPVDRTPTPVGGRLGSFASAWHRFSKSQRTRGY
ncbi:hypothetical protein DAPPUDRAFT_257735 [Daphnia pulex]|uniref:Uncharacterized protein n=1 Tax=Daphnia pulex TaxID=6669 RepID=E9HE43_DAPPU|nr:hypothetical protein DAPPUDRAFT_257735 [Daphnia pulex]|eukprot:EFX69948.1 hypothetical protein DAPPUDRAFT_257735 [Daphnia pulex]